MENNIDTDIKNLKNYIDNPDTPNLLFKGPHVVMSGYLRNDPAWSSKFHKHDSAEIIFCTEGAGYSIIKDVKYELYPGRLILCNPLTVHREASDPENPLHFFFVGLSGFQIPTLIENVLIPDDICPVQDAGEYYRQFELYFMELVHETIARRLHYKNISASLASCILALMLRLLNDQLQNINSTSRHSMRIKDYIDKNYTSDINLERLSDAIYISQNYISHIFKEEMGISPMKYVINKRISHAKHLLSSTSMSVSEIAAESGYKDPIYFSQIFKKITGCSPKKYRDEHGSLPSD